MEEKKNEVFQKKKLIKSFFSRKKTLEGMVKPHRANFQLKP